MTDFKAKLAEKRALAAKTALDKKLAKVKSDSAPNMNPSWTARKPKVEEPPPPDLKELSLTDKDKAELIKLVRLQSELGLSKRDITGRQKTITEKIKYLCKFYSLDKFLVDGLRANYYRITKTKISKELLLGCGVSPEIIAKCTVPNESWAFKVSGGGNDDEDEAED